MRSRQQRNAALRLSSSRSEEERSPLSVIIVHLNGGLGNQMFQYAAGRALSLRNGVPLRVDLATFEASGRRQYELEVFRVQAVPVNGADLDKFGRGAKVRAPAP